MESIFQISRREKRNVEICFLVREENENFCKKIEKSAIISLMWKREGFFSSWRESEIHLPPIPIPFLSSNVQIQNKDCVLENTITEEKWSFIGQCNDYPLYCISVVQPLKIFPQKALVGSLVAKHCWSKSTKIANLDFSRELEEKLRGKIERRKWTFLSQNFESWEENMFAKSHSFEKRNFSSKSRIPRGEREFFLQNLDNQDYIEKWKFNSPARERKKWTISTQDFLKLENPVNAVAARFVRVLRESCWLRWTKFYTNIVEY